MIKDDRCRQDQQIIRHLYIHIPYCLKKCNYCSFHSRKYSPSALQKYLTALHLELLAYKKTFLFKPKTIYLGGGTPSLLSTSQISQILQQFELSTQVEITLEANPSTITEQFAKDLKKSGVNRISLGFQSLDDNELKLLGRTHQAAKAIEAFRILRQVGFDNISVDLIYGLPQQKIADLQLSLQKIISLRPEHISTYCLSLDKDVPLYAQREQIPEDDLVADFYQLIREELLQAGYLHYEISSFALPGYSSRHNSAYWSDVDYAGLGAAAAGYLQGKRYQNKLLPDYIWEAKSGQIMTNPEVLSSEDKEKEFIFLALRTSAGLDFDLYRRKFGKIFQQEYAQIIEKYQDFLLQNKNNLALQPEAYFISNRILSDFM
jgi:oxygen-independent coproporphyrinogen-3 oxidase